MFTLIASQIVIALAFQLNEPYPEDLGLWYVVPTPTMRSNEWIAAEQDTKHDWFVYSGENGPRVKLREEEPNDGSVLPFEIGPGFAREGLAGRRVLARVENGWIIGFNAGEFGAGLWWFSLDGKKRQRISEDNVVFLFSTTVGLVAIEGIAHGGVSRGRLNRVLQGKNGQWRTEAFIDLGHAPQAAAKDADGSLVIATTHQLLRVDAASKKMEIIIDRAFWGPLYPSSLLISRKGFIYIGMRHGIVRVEKSDSRYKLFWLLPTKNPDYNKVIEGFH